MHKLFLRVGLKPMGVFAIGLLAAAGALLSAAVVSATSQRATRPLDTYTAGPVTVNMTEVGGQVTFQVTGLSIYNAFFDTDRTSTTGSAFDHGAECALNEVSTTDKEIRSCSATTRPASGAMSAVPQSTATL